MSTLIDNGGFAFPRTLADRTIAEGMTLRDWFAGQALNGYLASWNEAVPSEFFKPAYVANTCYEFADAMIAARKGGQA